MIHRVLIYWMAKFVGLGPETGEEMHNLLRFRPRTVELIQLEVALAMLVGNSGVVMADVFILPKRTIDRLFDMNDLMLFDLING